MSALATRRFYHVTPRDNLPEIARSGLLPRSLNGHASNFVGAGADPECVYLHPAVGCAQGWLNEHAERGTFGDDELALLMVDDVEVSMLWPDHEEFARHWWDGDGESSPDLPTLFTDTAVALPDLPPLGTQLDKEQVALQIADMPEGLRRRWVRFCVEVGDAVMLRDSITPDQLTLVEPLLTEDLTLIAERHLGGGEDDFAAWLEQLDAQGKLAISDETLRYIGQDPSVCDDTVDLRHFVWWPLVDAVGTRR